MKKALIFFGLIFSILCCNTTEPPPAEKTITLTLEDAASIEVWIKLTTTNLQLPATVTLQQNDLTRRTINLIKPDTLLYIDSLLPNQQYTFHAAIQPSSHTEGVKSNVLTVTTMDTTSHSFTWQTFTLGEHSSSVLRDVTIIDENNIWAAGEIYMNDSLGNPDPTRYNLAIWDGNDWAIKRVPYYYQGQTFYHPIQGIFAFAYDDIWFCGNGVIHWDGNSFVPIPIPSNVWGPHQMNKIWGTSSDDLYVVGNNGNIAHYSGPTGGWQKIESETDVDLSDVWGTPDGNEIWACGWSNQSGRVAILKIKGNGVESIWDSQTNTTLNIYRGTLLNSLWANGNGEFIFVGGQVLRHSLIDKRIVRLEWIRYTNGSKVLELGNYGYRIKGSNKNNIAIAGDAAMIWHYNGTSWHKYAELHSENDRLYGLAVNNDFIVAVGKRFEAGVLGGALLIIGRR